MKKFRRTGWVVGVGVLGMLAGGVGGAPGTSSAPATTGASGVLGTEKAKPVDMAFATADLKARGAWVHGELNRVEGLVAKLPVTTRPVLRSRDGRISPDPRPTPAKSVAAARALEGRVDAVVDGALAKLAAVAGDGVKYEKQFFLARLEVNETVDLVIEALKDTDVPTMGAAWLGTAVPVYAAEAGEIEAVVNAGVWQMWQKAHPDGVGGIGAAGFGGKESVLTLIQGQTVGEDGAAMVVSTRVGFRVNAAAGAGKGVTATTPNFTLVLTRPLELKSGVVAEKVVLEKRLSAWWKRGPVPEVSAAVAAPATGKAGK